MIEAALGIERRRMLDAMGVDVYALRDCAPANAAMQTPVSGAASLARLVAVCAHGVRGDARLARWFAQLPHALGVAAAAIHWIEADPAGKLPAPPPASAYLVLGASLAGALGIHLSTVQQTTSVIAVTSEPAQLPGNAMGKRALWQALKPLARRMRGGAA